MSDKTVRVLKQIDAAIKCIEHDYANPFNADVLLAAKGRIEELERAVLAASERDRRDAVEATPMVHQCCGREVCDGSDCPNKGPWYKVPKWRMRAYYFGFEPTGEARIDKILSAVACAGKEFHHTSEWNEELEAYHDHLRGNSPAEWIQNAAIDAAIAAAGNHKVDG